MLHRLVVAAPGHPPLVATLAPQSATNVSEYMRRNNCDLIRCCLTVERPYDPRPYDSRYSGRGGRGGGGGGGGHDDHGPPRARRAYDDDYRGGRDYDRGYRDYDRGYDRGPYDRRYDDRRY